MASDVVKGGWTSDEDEKLVKGIERYGARCGCSFNKKNTIVDLLLPRWSLVASVVRTRNSDRMWFLDAFPLILTYPTQNVLNVGPTQSF